MLKKNLSKNQKIFVVVFLILLSGVTIYFIGSFTGLWAIINGGTPGCPIETDPPGAFTLYQPTTPDTDGVISLEWSDSARVCHYNVWRQYAGLPDVKLAGGIDVNSYIDTVTENRFWYYRIEAYNKIGYTGVGRTYSNWVIVKVQIPIAPVNQAPTATITSISPNPATQGVDIIGFSGSGSDPDGSISAYNWRSSVDGSLSSAKTFTKSASSLSIGSHIIYFKVKDNNGLWSNEVSKTLTINSEPAPVIPDAPVLNSVTSPDIDGDITLNWNDVSGATSYKVYQSKDGGTFNVIASAVSVSTYTINDLINGIYKYKVKSVNSAGISGDSNIIEVKVQIPAELVIPDAPILDTPTYDVSEDYIVTIHLNWNDVDGADSYNVYRSVDGADYITIGLDLSLSNYNDIISQDGSYSYYITAINTIGESEHSSTATVEISGGEPTEPEDLTVAIVVLMVVIIGSVSVIYMVRRSKRKSVKKVK